MQAFTDSLDGQHDEAAAAAAELPAGGLSAALRRFLRRLFELDPNRRPNATQGGQHPQAAAAPRPPQNKTTTTAA